jgi:hypothetical protein
VLLGAAAGYQSFGAVLANGDTTYYAITNDTDWEVGIGTYSTTGPTLARTTILASSNGGAAVSWGVGVKNIFISYAASKSVYLDASGNLSVADKIIHTGDTDTSIRFPAADTVSIETNGTERFKVENSTITTTVPIALPADPTTSLQAATKSYVDTIASASIHYHTPVRVESPTALTVTYNNGTSGVGATLTNAGTQAVLVLDGVTLSVADRVLIYTQANQTQNGVYTVTNVGSVSTNWVMTRSTDTNTYAPSSPTALGAGDAFFVSQGATGAGELYVCNTTGTITFGTTNITFVQVAATAVYTAGTGISVTNNVITNTAPDQTVALTQGGATTITGTYPNFTISSTDTTYTAGGGIGLAGTTFSVAAGTGLTQDVDGLSHADTSSQASVDNTGATFVQDINLDGFGHVTGAASVTVTPSLIGAPQNDGTGATGTWGISISGNAANVTGTVAIANGGTGATTAPQALTNLAAAPLASPAFTGQASFADGSAAAPSIAHTGDLNAGLFFPAADTVAVATAGTERMRVSSAGDVGIGTASPSASLDVLTQVTGALGISLRGRSSDNVSDLSLKSNDAATVYGQIQGRSTDLRLQTGTALPITFFTNTTERMRITSAGNVGIGTSSPSTTLDVSGTVNATALSIGGTAITATAAELNFVDGVTSAIQTQLDAKAALASPALTGTPTAPTAAVATNTTQIATTAFVNAEIANDAPSKTGTGASGTWGIAISGNAATATTASNTTSISSAVGSNFIWTGVQQFQSNQNTTGSNPPLQAYSSSSGAIMSFHRAGAYAVNMGLDSDNVFRIGGWSAPANLLQMDMAGNLTMANNVTAYSDIRLKEDLEPIPDAIEKVQSLTGYTYTRIDSGQRQTGLIAQEVQKVLPEAVMDDGEHLSLAYGNMVGLLIEAIKEQQAQIDELRAKLEG